MSLTIQPFMKHIFLNEKTKSRKEGDGSTSESINTNQKACSSYKVATNKPTQKKSQNLIPVLQFRTN